MSTNSTSQPSLDPRELLEQLGPRLRGKAASIKKLEAEDSHAERPWRPGTSNVLHLTRPWGPIISGIDEVREVLDQRQEDDERTVATLARKLAGEQGCNETPPAPRGIEEWLTGNCPDDPLNEATARLERLFGYPAKWTTDGRVRLWAHFDVGGEEVVMRPSDVQAVWEADAATDGELKNPLNPLIRAYLDRSREVEPSRHPRPLLPDIRVIGETAERGRGRLYGIMTEERANAQVPLFGDTGPAGIIGRVPLLGITDATTGGVVTAQGRGAPLGTALPIHSMFFVAHKDRRSPYGVTIVVSVGELRNEFFPRGWERRRDWSRLRRELEALRNRFVPLANGVKWWPVMPGIVPGDDAGDDDLVVLHVTFPPGADKGTEINRRRLSELRVESGGAYRAMIAAAALAWQPGITRVKIKDRFGWTTDPGRYPILTRQDRRDVVFGAGDRSNRTRAAVDRPFLALEQAGDILIPDREAYDPERHTKGWRIIPKAAITNGLRERAAAAAAGDANRRVLIC